MSLPRPGNAALRLVSDPKGREPSLFGRRMAAAPSDRGHEAPPSSADVPAPANARQYLFQLNAAAQHMARYRAREALAGVHAGEIEQVVRAVARLRARYLAGILDLGAISRGLPTGAEVAQLRQTRESYDEMTAGLDALKSAIDSGEVTMEGLGGER